jgi:alpha-1,2-mannosyltransferase
MTNLVGQATSVIRFVVVGESSVPIGGRLNDPKVYARIAVFVVLLAIMAGVALRLAGYVGGAYSWFFLSNARDDSWFPMGLAYARVTGHSAGSLRDLFFVDHVKFQYPASSLLLYSGLDLIGITPTVKALNVLVWVSVFTTPFVVFQLCVAYIDKNRESLGISAPYKYMIAAAFAVSTLFFYPIMISWRLGQIQAMLNLAFALACLAWLYDRKFAAGALIGLSCLIKPQFSLFMVWALLRRQNRFVAGQALVLGCGLLLSLALYGWSDNIYYLDVLSYISHHGETFWDNSTVNGLVNGLIHSHDTLNWYYDSFPPYNFITYFLTMSSSVVIIGLALLINRSSRSSSSLLGFMLAGLSFTLASPIAWGHHYGVVMPMLAITFIEIARLTHGARRRNFLIGWSICLLLFSNYWNITEEIAGTPLGVLENWRLFAAVGLLWMLYRLQTLASAGSQGVEPNAQVPATSKT